jgi:SAM-dependent methyltransferase
MYKYDENFYYYINRGAMDSARVVIPTLLSVLQTPVTSVLDVGCGAGAWLTVWKSHADTVLGLDGNYVRPQQLLVSPEEFQPTDLSAAFDLNRPFGLVQSLEVAEHLPASSSAGFVQSLCRHSDFVLFSAAPPGQGGENHINEQPYEFWRELFRQQGYEMYDPVRRALLANKSVKPWYRYNTFLYVSNRLSAEISPALSAHRVEQGARVVDLSPPVYQLRKRLVSLLPGPASTALAIVKKTVFRIFFKLKDLGG